MQDTTHAAPQGQVISNFEVIAIEGTKEYEEILAALDASALRSTGLSLTELNRLNSQNPPPIVERVKGVLGQDGKLTFLPDSDSPKKG
jgi:hypothetical protein